ncbi:hypothetical protein PUNSTDRAFT_135671 [Punctularia strigosozonata HHB-11173 SS5]|uniref:uncharacterized protein n=1 Tax=Punctularia strigosozonata (strain HHB-11173) TaxID=741275 RepID=UPI00044173D7|nr:uncharacterized protein PUNSTDRAFT_135671 [Punctularia strigosozonata HHB-11173 SS5]EIN06971.1 hypothetical protein PUNSTDRAFT_135671 [Punctularia strigosozonata HHB-11173 SS5]
MVDRRREGEQLREEFSVLGSTGNVYTVVIDKEPSCNCPDAQKGHTCKHVLFVFLKGTASIFLIFASAPAAPHAVAHARVRQAYLQATGRSTTTAADADEASSAKKKRLPEAGDDCPICYETMHGVAEATLSFCDECGKGIHKECFQQWAKRSSTVTCVWCRAAWIRPGASSAGPRSGGGYVNLAAVAGVSPVRDTSSYFHGRPGYRHNYDYQDD